MFDRRCDKDEDIRALRSVGSKIGIYFVVTAIISTTIGIVVALIINPGKGTTGLLSSNVNVEAQQFSFIDQIIGWFPRNIVQAMAETNMLQIIIASIIIGLALLSLRRPC